jgi:hypothetical protein
MSYENSAGLGVSNHYGARNLSQSGGARGNDLYRTAEYTVDGDLVVAGVVPAGSVVVDVHTIDSAAPSAITVGGVSVAAADGTPATEVIANGIVAVTGLDDGGKVIIEYKNTI